MSNPRSWLLADPGNGPSYLRERAIQATGAVINHLVVGPREFYTLESEV